MTEQPKQFPQAIRSTRIVINDKHAQRGSVLFYWDIQNAWAIGICEV